IQRCLSLYEPRLRNIVISTDVDTFHPLTLRFYIMAEINSDALHEKVQFNLLLDQNRKYRVY
ncbi:type VI secretion system baseplate subunit TssE, partial [Vibrio metschnikovii]|nr:type VI secretion system baseplate subunit TssE [Vibrio metschnikovii]EKO3881475.1 type VI secretion system baseplate subunit TssE [Vibrio metschnikovii]